MEGVHVMGNVGERNIPSQMGQFRYHATIPFFVNWTLII